MRPLRAAIVITVLGPASAAASTDALELKYQFQRRGKPYIHSFLLKWSGPQASLQSIDVLAPETGDVIQTIAVPQDKVRILWKDLQASHPQETREAIFDQLDYNFDRFADMRLLREFPSKVGKKLYLIYLFDKDQNKYVLSEDISALPAPIPNPQSQWIESTDLGGFGGFESTTLSYSYSPFGKLTVEMKITRKVTDAMRLSVQKDVYGRDRGQLKLICRLIEEPEGGKRRLRGSKEECQKYLTPPKPKRGF